jgi:chromosome segregation and condensation protein ScpB
MAEHQRPEFLPWQTSGPRSPTPGAPYTYVTTKQFLVQFGFNSLRDLPDAEALEDELAFEGKAAGGRLAGGAR